MTAREVGGFVNAAGTFVAGHFRIGAEGAGAGDLAFFEVGGEDLFWGDSFFDPVHEGGEPVGVGAAGTARAVEHAGDHEESIEIAGGCGAEAFADGFVVFNAGERVDLLVGPARVLDDFAAALFEGGEVGVPGVEVLGGFGGAGWVLVEIELGIGPGGAGRGIEDVELHLAFRAREDGFVGGDEVVGPDQFAADGFAGEEELAFAVADAAVDFREGGHLRGSEAGGAVSSGAKGEVAFGLEVATAGVVDDAVGEAVDAVTFLVDELVEEGELFGGECRVAELGLGDPDASHDVAGEEEAGGTDDEAVEILGVALGFLQALAAAGGAADPIGVTGAGGVISLDDLLRENGGFVDGEVGEIDELAMGVGIFGGEVGEGGEGFFGGVVAGVGGDGGEAEAEGGIDGSEADDAGGAAVADHLETLVPVGGELEGEAGFGPDDAAEVAVGGEFVSSGDEGGGVEGDRFTEVFSGEGVAWDGGCRGEEGGGGEERGEE